MHMLRSVTAFSAISILITTAITRANAPTLEHRFFLRSGPGVDVRVDYDIVPSRPQNAYVSSPETITGGTVAIVAGPKRTRSIFPLTAIGAVPPAAPQTIPHDYRDGCRSNGPAAFEPLSGSRFPSLTVVTVIDIGGCRPMYHVFVPRSDTSDTYRLAPTYHIVSDDTRTASSASFVVDRVRSFVIPKAANESYLGDQHFLVIEGRDGTGTPYVVSVQTAAGGKVAATPGDSVTLYPPVGASRRSAGTVPAMFVRSR